MEQQPISSAPEAQINNEIPMAPVESAPVAPPETQPEIPTTIETTPVEMSTTTSPEDSVARQEAVQEIARAAKAEINLDEGDEWCIDSQTGLVERVPKTTEERQAWNDSVKDSLKR